MHLSITAAEEAADSAPFILRGPFSEAIRAAGIIGYDAIELHVADPWRLDAGALGQELERAGVRISTLGTGLCYAQDGLSLTSPDEQVRQQAVERTKAHVHFARHFGSSVIIGLIRGRISECESRSTYFSRLRDSLTDCLEAAEASDVPLVLESVNPLEADALTSAEETLAFINAMGSGRLLLHLDTYHMDLTGEPWAATFALAGKRLGHVHLADRNRLSPGSAGIDFAEVIRNLHAIGYQGSLAIECRPLPTPLQAAKDALAHVHTITRATDNSVSAEITIRNMHVGDYDRAYRLWCDTEGMDLTDDDQRERIALYLKFNHRLSFVALNGDALVGTILCGHDGRRGMIRHLAVRRDCRGRGIAKRLIRLAASALHADGIAKCNVCVLDTNVSGLEFWRCSGARLLDYDWRTLQLEVTRESSA